MNSLVAFRTGLAQTLRYWPVVVLLFAFNILGALLLTLLPASSLLGASYRTPFGQAADGVDPWLALETLLAAPTDTALGQADPGAGTRQIVLTALTVLGAAVPLAWLISAFVSGGAWLTYAESPERFGWRRFWWASWHWFGAFLVLGVIQGALVAAIGLPLVLVTLSLLFGPLRWLGWILGILLAAFAFAGLAVFEYAGAFMVLQQTRNPFRGLGQAIGHLFRNPVQWTVLYALALLLLLLVNAAYHFGLAPYLPLAWWPLLLGARQLFVAARLWARLARWAGVVATLEKNSAS